MNAGFSVRTLPRQLAAAALSVAFVVGLLALLATLGGHDASRVLDTENNDRGMAAVVENCRETTLALLDRLERSEELTATAVHRMACIESSVSEVSKLLRELDRSAFSNKLAALNAKIEAVRLGGRGLG